ncbi:MAG: TraR/DksA C4-type zinc finger protein [Nannocystaceae bacterium]|nr:TraR/DksA C4-type zinc finger protein [Nannocystaceae bacterium]
MEHLSREQIEGLQGKLIVERDRLLVSIDDEELTAESNDYLGDIEDKAAEEHRRSTARLRQGHHTARVAELKAAIGRIAQGTYGYCDETGEMIPFGRLSLDPATRYTVDALELLEDENAREKLVRRDEGDKAY